MKRMKKWILLLIGILITLLIVLKIVFHQFKLNVYDGFEAAKLNKIWTNARMEQDAFEIQSKIVHSGKSAAEITLKYGDKVESNNGKDKDSERDELMESRKLYAVA
jgi:cell division protein FtsL